MSKLKFLRFSFSFTFGFWIIMLIISFLFFTGSGEDAMLKLWFYGGIPLCFTGLLPSIIAHAREHPRKTTIFWINVLLSATGFGWLLAMGLAIGLIQPEWDKRLDPVSETDSTSETVSISVADELEKLVAMKEKGLLTDQEFSDAKEKLLS